MGCRAVHTKTLPFVINHLLFERIRFSRSVGLLQVMHLLSACYEHYGNIYGYPSEEVVLRSLSHASELN